VRHMTEAPVVHCRPRSGGVGADVDAGQARQGQESLMRHMASSNCRCRASNHRLVAVIHRSGCHECAGFDGR
jgi:hypothetical protein